MKEKSFFFAQTLRFFLELLLISLSFSLRPIWPIFRNIVNIQPKNWLFLQYFHLNLVFPQHTLQCILSHFYRGQFLQLFLLFWNFAKTSRHWLFSNGPKTACLKRLWISDPLHVAFLLHPFIKTYSHNSTTVPVGNSGPATYSNINQPLLCTSEP